MKRATKTKNGPRREYSPVTIGRGTRGKYYENYLKGSNLVLLEPDVATSFPTSRSVNEALRAVVRIARNAVGKSRR